VLVYVNRVKLVKGVLENLDNMSVVLSRLKRDFFGITEIDS
jgi:hypothetical protein